MRRWCQRQLIVSAHRLPRAIVASSVGSRKFVHTCPSLQHLRKSENESTETMLMQQMLDAMGMDEEEEQEDELKLPITGVVLDIQNNLATISGLRDATIGSVISLSSSLDDKTCVGQGIVLFLQKKVAHVALLNVSNAHIGMQAQLDHQELQIAVSFAHLKGQIVDSLGKVLENENEMPTTNDQISVAWNSKTVPGLMTRGLLRERFGTGVLAIDCFKPLAFGHRVALLGPKHSGKTRLMLEIMIHQIQTCVSNGTQPPHFIYVCIGKSRSRVHQIYQYLEHHRVLEYMTIVSADDRDSMIKQYLAPFTGCALAEYYMKHGPSNQSVVIYDDLAVHTTVVESLVHMMKLPKISQLSLSGHAVLMERSAQFQNPHSSLTTFVLADTPDIATGEVSEFQERLVSIVDEAVVLDSAMTRARVSPPINVLAPGGSIRGPPFLSMAQWTFMNRIRTRINHAAIVKENIDVGQQLGLEMEPEQMEVVEFQALVRQLFESNRTNARDVTIAIYILSGITMAAVPRNTTMWEIVDEVISHFEQVNPEILTLIASYPVDQRWNREIEQQVDSAVASVLVRLRREKEKINVQKERTSPAALVAMKRQRR